MPESTAGTRLAPNSEPRRSTRFRFDRGSTGGPDLAPGRGSLLGSFGVWSGHGGDPRKAKGRPDRSAPKPAPAAERRTNDRHRVECLAWVGWKTWRRFHMSTALMIDLSRGGARIFLDAAPPGRRPLWIFIETPSRQTIVRARVLETETASNGQCAIRVVFDDPCPYTVFEVAVCGLASVDPKRRIASAPRIMAVPVRAELAG